MGVELRVMESCISKCRPRLVSSYWGGLSKAEPAFTYSAPGMVQNMKTIELSRI